MPYCDTRGLAELIVSLTIVEGAQGTLKLVNVQLRATCLPFGGRKLEMWLAKSIDDEPGTPLL